MRPGRLAWRIMVAVFLALSFAFCGCAPDLDGGSVGLGMAIGVMGVLLFGAVFGGGER